MARSNRAILWTRRPDEKVFQQLQRVALGRLLCLMTYGLNVVTIGVKNEDTVVVRVIVRA